MSYIYKNNGFTLIEAVIGMAVFSIFALMITSIYLNALRALTKEEALKEVKQSGEYAMRRIASDIREADTVTNCTGTNSIEYIDNQEKYQYTHETRTTVDLDTIDSLIRQKRNALDTDWIDTEYLSNNLVTLLPNTLMFMCQDKKVEISFSLSHAKALPTLSQRADTVASIPFRTTVVNRQ